MMDVFVVAVTSWGLKGFDRVTKETKVFGIDNAKMYAKLCRQCSNVVGVDVMSASTGEIVYASDENGKVIWNATI